LSLILLREKNIQEECGLEPAHLSSGILRSWRRALGRFRGRGLRCRGCGGRREPGPLEALPARQEDRRVRAMAALCVNCRGFVEQMNQDTRIIAVFIFSLGKEAKYYAGFRTSTS
jgi:hypothetical protein